MNTEDFDPKGQQEAQPLSAAALARRRMLLKGLGRGGALLAAAVPLKTLASTSVCTQVGKDGHPVIRCGISGMQSGIGLRETYTTCGGYSPGYYKTLSHWPKGLNPDATCVSLFSRCKATVATYTSKQVCTTTVKGHWSGSGKNRVWVPPVQTCTTQQVASGTRPATLIEVLTSFENTDEFHWIAAWLNASGGAAALNFPYTANEVLSFYNDTGNGIYGAANALIFFKNYMELA